ncbi:SoxR reducing system RseC family protein [Vibrio sonorensis]|uniref:SoxR reducing system RseC family protein n=1 Tax=Vibrio sonorensis TaxID=1004316 RepID=UPI0008DA17FB|nr:SoxR reducing system RseC family protein [Vibrio sonorensis]
MMTAMATVVSVHKEKLGFNVELSCQQQTSCSSCSSQQSCGTGVVSKVLGNKTLRWTLKTKEKMNPGQVVEIGLPESSLLKSASIVYLVPLFAMIAGALFGQWIISPMINGGELPIILCSALSTWAGIGLAKKLSSHAESEASHKVVLLRKFGNPIS